MKSELYYDDDFFEVTTRGDADLKGFEDFIDLMLGHEKWKPGAAFLVDHSELNAGPLTVDEVRGIARMCGKRRRNRYKSRKTAMAMAFRTSRRKTYPFSYHRLTGTSRDAEFERGFRR